MNGSHEALIIRPEVVIDAVSDDPQFDTEIVVVEGRIKEIRGRTKGSDEGIEIFELPGRAAVPGLIDCHVHYLLDSGLEVANNFARGASDPAEHTMMIGVRNTWQALKAGVTTARSAGAAHDRDVPLARAIDRGYVPGPRILPSGRAITITGGHGMLFGITADSHHEMVRTVRELVWNGAEVIKVVASEAAMLTTNLAGVPEMTTDEIMAIVSEAKRLNRRVLAHAQDSSSVIAAAQAGAHSIEHAFLADKEALGVLAESGAYLTPTLTVSDVYQRLPGLSDEQKRRQAEISRSHRISCETAIELGIPLTAGTDCGVRGVHPHMLAREVALMEDHGLSPMEALRTATVNAADLLDVSEEVGSLEPGKKADILIVEGDPLFDLESLGAPELVFQSGRLVFSSGGRTS